ncbi:MAG TPA: hemerythrin domain-containing protein [Candidatus Binatia bacterium]|jgi:hemerythrin-like domain-containing protein
MPRHPSLIPLSHDHHHGLALALRCRKQALGRLKPLGIQGLKERAQELKEFFRASLTPHFAAEEVALFPFMRSSIPESEPLISELLGEHEQLRGWVGLLDDEKHLAKTLFEAADLLERHIRREERELFPLFEAHAAPAGAESIGREIAKMIKHEHPQE